MAEAALASLPAAPMPEAVRYPDSDGRPMADNTPQYWAMADLTDLLLMRFVRGNPQDRPARQRHAYVGCNTLLYYERDKPWKRLSPDVYAVFGVEGIGALPSYRTWEIGKAPDFVMEVASPGTARRDRLEKPSLYAGIGVAEYWRFDPSGGQVAAPPLAGTALRRGRYVELPRQFDGNRLVCFSPVLGLLLEAEPFALGARPEHGPWGLFLRDPGTGLRLRDHEAEKVRADDAEARAKAEKVRADDAQGRAKTEKVRADAAEARNARLLEELEALRGNRPGGH